MKELLSRTVCTSPSEKCYHRRCDDCRYVKASDIICDGANIENQEPASWSIWKSVNSRYELLKQSGTFGALLKDIDELWPNFITHSFCTRMQREYITLIKETSTITTFAVIQLDFAQNFTFVTQREVQSAYYTRRQATLFTVYIRIGEEYRNMALVSDYLAHDTRFVYCAQKIILDFVKKEYPNIIKVNYVSDGASGHFKSEFSIFNNNIITEFFSRQIQYLQFSTSQKRLQSRRFVDFQHNGAREGTVRRSRSCNQVDRNSISSQRGTTSIIFLTKRVFRMVLSEE